MSPGVESRTRVELHIPPSIPAGESIPVAVTLENTSSGPVDLYLQGREITVDLEVARAGGQPIWRRLDGEIVQGILALRTLEPGEVIELHAEWDQRDVAGKLVGPGSYTMVARILTDGSMTLESPAVSFNVDSQGG